MSAPGPETARPAGVLRSWQRRLYRILLVPLGYFWYPWTFWGIVLFWLGRRHPVVEDHTPLSPGRRQLGWIVLLVFAFCICLVPLAESGF